MHPSVGSLCLQGVPQHLAGPGSCLEDSSRQAYGLPGQRVSQYQPRLEMTKGDWAGSGISPQFGLAECFPFECCLVYTPEF